MTRPRGSRHFGERDHDARFLDETSDPDVLFGRSSGPDRKTLQLCRQVERTLALVLAGECGDDDVRDACLEHVAPAPDASRMLVTVVAASATDPDALLAKLQALAPFLRARVAAAIHRKRAPTLVFALTATRDEELP